MKSLFRYLHLMLAFWYMVDSNYALADESHSIFRLTNGLPYARIPFQFIQNMIILPVTLNGQQEYNFILDTGTRTPIMLNKKAMQSLGLPRGRDISFSGVGSTGMVRGFTVDGIRMELPGIEATGISVVVLEENYLNIHKLSGVEIHGIMGATLFQSLVVNIDYPNRVIDLIDKNDFHPCAQYISMVMQIVDSKPVIQAELHIENEVYHARLVVDTGFNHELLIRSGIFVLPASARHTRLGRGVGGLINGMRGKVDHLKLDTLTIENVMALFPTIESYPSDDQPMLYQGTIGNGLLKRYNIVLDYAGEKLYFVHPSLPAEEQVASLMVGEKMLQPFFCSHEWKDIIKKGPLCPLIIF